MWASPLMSGISSFGFLVSDGVDSVDRAVPVRGGFCAHSAARRSLPAALRDIASGAGSRSRSTSLRSSAKGLIDAKSAPFDRAVQNVAGHRPAAACGQASTSSSSNGPMKAWSAPVATPIPTLQPASSSVGNALQGGARAPVDPAIPESTARRRRDASSSTDCAGRAWAARRASSRVASSTEHAPRSSGRWAMRVTRARFCAR